MMNARATTPSAPMPARANRPGPSCSALAGRPGDAQVAPGGPPIAAGLHGRRRTSPRVTVQGTVFNSPPGCGGGQNVERVRIPRPHPDFGEGEVTRRDEH